MEGLDFKIQLLYCMSNRDCMIPNKLALVVRMILFSFLFMLFSRLKERFSFFFYAAISLAL